MSVGSQGGNKKGGGLNQFVELFVVNTEKLEDQAEAGVDPNKSQSPKSNPAPNKSVLFSSHAAANPSINATLGNPTHLTDSQYVTYQNSLGGSYYDAMAKLATLIQDNTTAPGMSGQTAEFQERLNKINPIVEFAMKGAKREWDEETNPVKKKEAEEKFIAFERVNEILTSLKALSNSKYRYDKDYYVKKMQDLSALVRGPGLHKLSTNLYRALDNLIRPELFQGRDSYPWQTKTSGSTGFNDTAELDSDPDIKKSGVKIHKEKDVIKGTFSYDRKKLLMDGDVFEKQRFEQQVKDYVTVLINEYGKGTTKDKPLKISFKGDSQDEAALQILMEYKKRAILEGKIFYAQDPSDPSKTVNITPGFNLTKDEENLYLHYAKKNPGLTTRHPLVGGHTTHNPPLAGYSVLKENLPSTIQGPNKITDSQFLLAMKASWKGAMNAKKVDMDVVASNLSTPKKQAGAEKGMSI